MKEAIAAAEVVVKDKAAVQADVDAEAAALEKAIERFKNSIIRNGNGDAGL